MRVIAIWIRILGLDDLCICVPRPILLIEIFQTARFEITRRKRESRFLCLCRGAMKKRKRAPVVFLREKNFRDTLGGWPREFTLAVFIHHSLETGPRGRATIERAITFA